jgi:hypothetical protein
MGEVIEQHIFGTAHLEQIMRDAIAERLGSEYAGALKGFQVEIMIPTTVQESIQMKRDFPQGIFKVSGYLALDDSKVGGKYFEVNIEQGLSKEKDEEISKELAFQCYACCREMERYRKAHPDEHKLVING